MFNYFKKIITNGADVPVTAKRIGMYHLRGQLTDSQAEELYDQLNQNADFEANRPEVSVTLESIVERLEAIESRLSTLEIAAPENSEDSATTDIQNDYQEWKPWDGISRNYRYGDIVRHNGELWISEWVYQNTWEPGVIGTEKMWAHYVEPTSETDLE